ncbi:AMP-binding protein [Micromonospora aurantiaca (nom. illeg.)]|uniref:AMP-binding protein n=1 Tax=Micromonospora aurantiaca (nom. illeg.) TaxID=47850 RepID=UPI0033C64E4C
MQTEHRVIAQLAGRPLATVRTEGTSQCLSEVLDRAAHGTTTVGTIDSDGTQREETWRAFRDRVRLIAGDARRGGLDHGSIVVVAATEPSEILALFWSSVVAGAEPLLVPAELLDDRAGGEWLAALAEHAPVRALVHARAARFRVVSEASEWGIDPISLDLDNPGGPDGADPAAADGPLSLVHFMTSGSTGAPKVVPQRHRGIIDMALGAVAVNGLDSTTVGFNWMPLSHVGGMLMAHVRDAVIAARHLSVATERILTDPGEWFRLVTEHRVSAVWSPNFAYRMLANEAENIPPYGPVDLASIRFCLNGGEAVSAKDCARFEESLGRLGLPKGTIAPAWGMAETCSGVLYAPHYDPLADSSPTVSVGFPLPGVEVRIVATDAAEDGLGVGHLEVRGSPVLERYLVGGDLAMGADGWFRTGDIARIDDSGVHFVGRDGTRIVANGVTWNSADLEGEVERVKGVVPGTCAITSFRAPKLDRDQIAVFCTVDGDVSAVRGEVRRCVETIIGGPVAHVIDIPAGAIERTSIGKVRKGRLVRRFINPDPPRLWELEWVARPSPAEGTPAKAQGPVRKPVVLRGCGLVHSAVAGCAPGQLHEALEHWRQAAEPDRLRGQDVVILVEAREGDARRLPRSHPVAAYLRAVAHGAGARSVRTVWMHPLAHEQVLDDILAQEQSSEAGARPAVADLFVGPRGDLWRRVLAPVDIGSDAPPATHAVLLGGTGRLGEALGAELSARGLRVTLVGHRARSGSAPAGGVDRVFTDIASTTAVGDLLEKIRCAPAEQALVVHLAGEPRPAPQDALARLLGPKTDGVRTAVELAHALDAPLAVVSSVNAHVAGTGVETYSAACAAAEVIAEQATRIPVTVVAVTSVREARQTDEANVAVAQALGLDEISVMDVAACVLARPSRSVLLGVREDVAFLPQREGGAQPSPDADPPGAGTTDEAGWSPTVSALALGLRPLVGVEPVRPHANWFDMGLTSVDLPNLARALAGRTDRKIGVLELMRFPSLAALAEHIDDSGKRNAG